jgi:hypothetical protein
VCVFDKGFAVWSGSCTTLVILSLSLPRIHSHKGIDYSESDRPFAFSPQPFDIDSRERAANGGRAAEEVAFETTQRKSPNFCQYKWFLYCIIFLG